MMEFYNMKDSETVTFEFDLTELNTGVYVIDVVTGNHVLRKKINKIN